MEKVIAAQHNGKLWVESDEGKGGTFALILVGSKGFDMLNGLYIISPELKYEVYFLFLKE